MVKVLLSLVLQLTLQQQLVFSQKEPLCITQLNFVGAEIHFRYGSTVNIGIRGTGVGIQSGGVLIGTGVTQFNFLGLVILLQS